MLENISLALNLVTAVLNLIILILLIKNWRK